MSDYIPFRLSHKQKERIAHVVMSIGNILISTVAIPFLIQKINLIIVVLILFLSVMCYFFAVRL